jgi:hypothetical protein
MAKGIQFFHLNKYGKTVSKNKKCPHLTLDECLGEMLRRPGCHPHVKNPVFKVLHGDPSKEWARLRREQARQTCPDGRGIRTDAIVALIGVVSYPRLLEGIREDEAAMSDLVRWTDDNVGWLKSIWGRSFRTAVVHLDEDFPHLHFMVSPDLLSTTMSLHHGEAAKARAQQRIARLPKDYIAGLSDAERASLRREPNLKYKAAMALLQDSYFENVAAKHGHGRIGPLPRRKHYDSRTVSRMKRTGDWIPRVGPIVRGALAPESGPPMVRGRAVFGLRERLGRSSDKTD